MSDFDRKLLRIVIILGVFSVIFAVLGFVAKLMI
nr:MAG TPA: protein of unknown function (DUF5408) [Caudoviricetes sp.]